MEYKVFYINKHNGNWARWRSTDATIQAAYKKHLENIKSRFVDEFEASKKMIHAFYLALLLFAFISNTACATPSREEPSSASQNREGGSCYGYLTELVRSSNFPFKYVNKEKTNLLIDNDTGDSVTAKLFFDTNGTGTIGWVQYAVTQRQLFNISGDMEESQELTFDTSFAIEYETCIGQ